MTNYLNGNQMKAILLDYLIDKSAGENSILASEASYLSGLRKVDILKIGETNLCAFEIKSDFDTLNRLKNQLKDYQYTFDFLSVLTSIHLQAKIHNFIPNGVGLLVIDDNMKIIVVQQSMRRKRILKRNLAHFLWRQDIIKELKARNVKIDYKAETYKLRSLLTSRITLNSLHSLAIKYLNQRYKGRYQNFLSEKGRSTHVDDVRILSINDEVLLRR